MFSSKFCSECRRSSVINMSPVPYLNVAKVSATTYRKIQSTSQDTRLGNKEPPRSSKILSLPTISICYQSINLRLPSPDNQKAGNMFRMCFGLDKKTKYYYREEVVPVRRHDVHSHRHRHQHRRRSPSPPVSYTSVSRRSYSSSPRRSVSSYRVSQPVIVEQRSTRTRYV